MRESWERVSSLDEISWPDDAVLICDQTVRHLAPRALQDRALFVDAGESLKRLNSIEELAERVLAQRSSRPLTLIAMGGGSVGDAVGFLASILWRGVELWHIPTTVLAAVDSAHGGKTAVNLGLAKNQLGTFWPAARTIFSDGFMKEMPVELRAGGLTELVKGLWLGDAAALDTLDKTGVGALANAPWDEVAEPFGQLLDAAVAVKHHIVARDPRETQGIRSWLNLGHTVAHALELTCGVSHGVAVAWGLACAARVSCDRGMLSGQECERLQRHALPLMGHRPLAPDRGACLAAIARDKKTLNGRLRSVLLRGAGDPVLVDDVTAEEWMDAFYAVHTELFDGPIRVHLRSAQPARLEIAPSKSELNRALAICALRGVPAPTAQSDADDVRAMRAGIAALEEGECAFAGNGGTTFRFLTAVAVAQPNGGTIEIGPQLAQRPHGPLLNALRGAGIAAEQSGRVFRFGPLPSGAVRFEVDASKSSQFASALTLLKATGRDITVDITGDIASPGYFHMTEAMLEMEPVVVSADASSAVIWHVLNRLGFETTLVSEPGPLQPDAVVAGILWDAEATDPLELNVGDAPDLVPVLAAYATRSQAAVRLIGAPQLRHKESNRIEDLVAAFGEVGVRIEALDDGIAIPAGKQAAQTGAVFSPRDDHRLVFAAIVLATAAELVIDSPRCAAKSYPRIFSDARRAGFSVEANGSACRSPDT